ncbi:hypothetical protein AVEN_265207-1 [Araneus ventricosus]|uniref:Uncharacterized protein n=1 Tax=Araneus ventricosus TaxID=182803 RepID=A0A4Y2CNZ6_ARAVE|nr:hypothetical protein AVEN_265207-1 [Araneus ventricosus]
MLARISVWTFTVIIEKLFELAFFSDAGSESPSGPSLSSSRNCSSGFFRMLPESLDLHCHIEKLFRVGSSRCWLESPSDLHFITRNCLSWSASGCGSESPSGPSLSS